MLRRSVGLVPRVLGVIAGVVAALWGIQAAWHIATREDGPYGGVARLLTAAGMLLVLTPLLALLFAVVTYWWWTLLLAPVRWVLDRT